MAFTPEQIAHFEEQAEALRAAGISDDDAREAIDGYLQAALFVGTPDSGDLTGAGLSFSAEAQEQARDDVLEFITKHHENIAVWRERTGHEWLQVGIDLYFTRNRREAGFWSRDNAGLSGEWLTNLSHMLPEVTLIRDEDGELVFE